MFKNIIGSFINKTKSSDGIFSSLIKVGTLSFLAIPISLLTSVVLARTLEPAVFGQYAFIMSLTPLLALPMTGGMKQLLTRQIARYNHSNEWGGFNGIVKSSFIWTLLVSIVIGIFVLYLTNDVGFILKVEQWRLLSISMFLIPILGFISVRQAMLQGLGFPFYSELSTLLFQPFIVLLLLVVIGTSINFSIELALFSQIFAALITFGLLNYFYQKINPKHNINVKSNYEIRSWFFSMLPFTLIVLTSSFNTQIGILVLGVMGSDEAIAGLRVAERGAQFVALSLGVVNIVIGPKIVVSYKENNLVQLQKMARQTTRYSLLFALTIGCTLILFGKPIISVLFGSDYVSLAYYPLIILVIAQIINVFCGSSGQLLSMSGFEKDTLKGQIVALIVNVISCAIFVPLYGAIGAAIGVSIGLVVWNVILSVMVYRRLGISSLAI